VRLLFSRCMHIEMELYKSNKLLHTSRTEYRLVQHRIDRSCAVTQRTYPLHNTSTHRAYVRTHAPRACPHCTPKKGSRGELYRDLFSHCTALNSMIAQVLQPTTHCAVPLQIQADLIGVPVIRAATKVWTSARRGVLNIGLQQCHFRRCATIHSRCWGLRQFFAEVMCIWGHCRRKI
jgi:hypothetical protein